MNLPRSDKSRPVLQLLRKVGDAGELSLSEVLDTLPKTKNSHEDVYPLAALIEGGYLGVTFTHEPPPGAENMREFNLAYTLHMLGMKRSRDGDIEYRGVRSGGSMSPDDEKVFLKVKGALYLEELDEKRRDRMVFVFLGLASGLAALFAKEALTTLFSS